MYDPQLQQLVQSLITDSSWIGFFRSKSNHPHKESVLSATTFLPSTAKLYERLNAIANNIIERPLCPVCYINRCNWYADGKVYRKHCSSARCKQDDPTTKITRKHTNIDKYGADNIMSTEEGKNRQQQTMVERYGVTHAMKSGELKLKTQQTNIDRYGVKSTALVPEFISKRKSTNLDRYGVEDVLQSPEIQQKVRDTVMERYGVKSTTQLPEIRRRQKNTWNINNSGKYPFMNLLNDVNWLQLQSNTKTQCQIADELQCTQAVVSKWCGIHGIASVHHPISYLHKQIRQYISTLYDGEVIDNDRSILKPKELDILIPDLNLAVEVDGLRWHGELNDRGRDYHRDKTQRCNLVGIDLIHITDYQWITKRDIVESRLAIKMGVIANKIAGRKTVVKVLDSKATTQFLNSTHIQGSCGSAVSLGLMVGDELISVMTFGHPRFNKHHDWELLRYSTRLHTVVLGGAAKLFQYFLKNYAPSSIISYCDLSWNTGGVYDRLGFNYTSTSLPNYWYFHVDDTLKIYHRSAFQKHKLAAKLDNFDPNLTEWENMVNNGYDRYWDCGNSVWVYES